jgi:hypothetical protein
MESYRQALGTSTKYHPSSPKGSGAADFAFLQTQKQNLVGAAGIEYLTCLPTPSNATYNFLSKE